MQDTVQTLTYEQLEELPDDKRIIVVHPSFQRQHTLLDSLLQEPQSVYVRFNGQKLSQDELREQFETALSEQEKQLDQTAMLVLDEYDRATGDAVDNFIEDVLSRYGQGRIALVGRTLPFGLLQDTALRSQMAFVPTDPSMMLWDYANRDQETSLLEVRAFGSGHVMLNGRQVENWDGVLPRSLFFYLVDRGMTTRSDIFQTFWPNLSVREATNVFHVTKRKISEVLGMDLTMYWSGFYRISPDIELSYDAVTFSELVQNSAVASLDEAAVLLRKAVDLYKGNFLSSVDMEWVTIRRDELMLEYADALAGLGRAKKQEGDLQAALGLYLRASVTDRQREDLVYSIMQIYDSMGMPDDALLIYDHLQTAVSNGSGNQPADYVRKYADELRAKQQV